MSAKFIAQIEISKPCVSSESSPAEATRPRIVSISGSPAATSEPNASTRIASVTGQEKSSDFIIAVRLAVLKSDHMPEAPVRLTDDRRCRRRVQLALERVGGGDHRGRVALRAGQRRSRCGRRREIDAPGARRHDRRRRAGPSGGRASTCASGAWNAGVADRQRRRVDDDHQRGAREAGEVAAGSARAPGPTRSRWPASRRPRAPSRPAARRPRARPRPTSQASATSADVVGRPAAEPTDRADRLRMLVAAGDTGAAAATTTSWFLLDQRFAS